jgi:hypothetical protein
MPRSLADQYARSVAFARKINQRMDRLKALMEEQVKANDGKPLVGTDYEVSLVVTERKNFDNKKARTYLTRSQIVECEKAGKVRNWVVSERVCQQIMFDKAA